jgi:hypothetical protein
MATGSKRQRLAIVVLGYLVLWGGTQLVGAPAVRSVTGAAHPAPSDIALRWSICRAYAVAPFLVKSEYGWRGKGAMEGLGGATLYLWLVRPIAIWELEQWMG